MAKEIERKFLVDLSKLDLTKLTNWTTSIKQGYLATEGSTVRIRIEDTKGFITIKGKTSNITRNEFEYEIPYNDAVELMKMCGDKVLIKKRTMVKFNRRYWSVDVFEGDNDGLIVAEIELKNEKEKFALPPWVTREVYDNRYFNSNLVEHPYKNWKI